MNRNRLLSGLAVVTAIMCLVEPDAVYGGLADKGTGGSKTVSGQNQNQGRSYWELQFTDRETGRRMLWERGTGDGKDCATVVPGERLISLKQNGMDWSPPSQLAGYFQKAREQESEITGEPPDSIPDGRFYITNQSENYLRIQFIASYISEKKSAIFYMIGKNFIPNGVGTTVWLGDKTEFSCLAEETVEVDGDLYRVTKMKVSLYEEQENTPVQQEKLHWNLGDVVERELDGKIFRFQCIDQNYSDRMENHRPSALFLCRSVIPADWGSVYRYEELEDGTFDYVFYPGPLVSFGDGNDYKDSKVRAWLKACEGGAAGAETVSVGVDLAYTGSTGVNTYSQLEGGDLKGEFIGFQKLSDRFFILSVDEALNYRDELWNVEGDQGPYSKGYWLRNPCGGQKTYDTGLVYIVDLVNGMIRPQEVKPGRFCSTGNEEMTGTTGVRPAFTMAQDW